MKHWVYLSGSDYRCSWPNYALIPTTVSPGKVYKDEGSCTKSSEMES